MSHESPFISKSGRVTAAAVGLGLLAGCSGGAAEQPAPAPSESANITFVPMYDQAPQDMANGLNKWLKDNPTKHMTGMTGVPSRYTSLAGFQVMTEEGQNTGQSCTDVPVPGGEAASGGANAYGNGAIQEWKDAHPKEQIIGFTARETYPGVAAGYIICANTVQKG
jgi:hypothetical protein